MGKIISIFLIFLTLNLYFSKVMFAEENQSSIEAGITKHTPEFLLAPEEDIPRIKEKKISPWTWAIIIGLIGGVAAVASGGDEGGKGSNTGSTTISW